MRKKIIEQIKKIKGVKNVDLVDGLGAAVTFEKEEVAVELVDGRIYYTEDDDGGSIFIFRFKSIKGKHLSLYYSCNNPFQVNECILTLATYRKTKPATTKQSAKLVKQELKNGYFWNGTELIKFK